MALKQIARPFSAFGSAGSPQPAGGRAMANRILETTLGLAGTLILTTAASGAPYSFDVSRTGSATFDTVLSSLPSAPCGNGESGIFLTCPFSAGSTINLDISAGIARITSGTLEIDSLTSLAGGLVVIATDQTVSLSGGYGALSGDDIVWTGPVTYSVAGTFTCSGECSALRFAFGTSPIASLLYNGVEASPVDPVVLGTWTLDAGLTSILATTRATTSISRGGYAPLGAPMSWLVFGPSDLGEVPEPASSIMVVLGLGGLSLRLIAQRLRPPYPAIHPDRLESSSSSI